MDNKFKHFNQMIAEAKQKKIDVVLVYSPHVLGDNYEELVTNLNKIADANLSLRILPALERRFSERSLR